MEENYYKKLMENNFECYKSYINFIKYCVKKNDIYSILILKKNIINDMVKVSIIIKNCNSSDDNNMFYSNVILNKYYADKLIYNIREEFKNSNDILYSMINPKSLIHTLKNTNFYLNIKLNNSVELDEALNFNHVINSRKNVRRALIKS